MVPLYHHFRGIKTTGIQVDGGGLIGERRWDADQEVFKPFGLNGNADNADDADGADGMRRSRRKSRKEVIVEYGF
jgi:hypothetical protein